MLIKMKTIAASPEGSLIEGREYLSSEIGEKFAKDLVDGGYAEVLEEDVPETTQDEDNGEIKAIDEMTLKELQAYAEEKNIDLTGKKTKPEVLKVIKAAVQE